MGSSIYWYRVDAEDFKKYLKVEDKFYKYEQKLYEKYQSVFDADTERFNREWEEVCNGKRSAKSVKEEVPVYKVVTPAEFDKWFALMRKMNSLKEMASIEKLPHLYTGSSRSKVLAQWLLNRRRKFLVKSNKSQGYELRPKNEEWRFILTPADVTDLLKRLDSLCGLNPVDAHKAFPIYSDIIFGDSRKKFAYLDERSDLLRFAPHFLKMLNFTVTYILGDISGPGYKSNPLMMEILP
jgi:hypothetical protein